MEEKRIKHRFFNMYLTTTISIMLVLILVGAGCVLLLSAEHLARQVRQNVAIDVVLVEKADSACISDMSALFSEAAYVHEYQYISREQALEEHIRNLGEDPTRFLGYNPLHASFEVKISDRYAQTDSLVAIAEELEQLPQVVHVIYDTDVVTEVNHYVNRVMWILLAGVSLLLIIAWALITNMIRLQLYSKRFLIHTMTMVGATGWHIRRPFILQSITMGIIAAILAYAVLVGGIYTLQIRWGVLLFPITPMNGLMLGAPLLITAIFITLFASLAATGRYIRMDLTTLYEI